MENTVNANLRSNTSKGGNNRLRRAGRVPGIIYGHNYQGTNVDIDESELIGVLKKTGDHGVVNVNVNNKNEKAFIKEVQRDNISNHIIHIDLMKVDENQKIRTKVPIKLVGEAALKNFEMMAQLQMDEAEVEGMPSNLPKYLEANVSGLNYGEKLTLQNIEVAEEISIIGDPDAIVAVTVTSRPIIPIGNDENEKYADPIIVHADNQQD